MHYDHDYVYSSHGSFFERYFCRGLPGTKASKFVTVIRSVVFTLDNVKCDSAAHKYKMSVGHNEVCDHSNTRTINLKKEL